MHGFYGRIITINLTDESFTIEPLPETLQQRFLGGKGLATHLLMERNPAGVDPLSPDNHLIIAAGPFCQSRVWGGSRYGVFTKSPLTGLYAESYAGGKVPEAIDSTGFDAVLVKGRSKGPCIICIYPDGVIFNKADDLWGKDTFQTEDEANRRFTIPNRDCKKSGAVVIGPAAENLVSFALIENDKWRSAGRAGTGTVMGSKKLKAIVFQGNRQRRYKDPEGLTDYCKTFLSTNREQPGVKAYKGMGTTMMVAVMNTIKAFPARYWYQGTCDHWEKISGEAFHKEHDVTPRACAKCFMACGRMATLRTGRHTGLKIEGPEYETIYAFGGLCMVEDIGEIAYLNDICDRLGMDTITAGNLCAFTIEAVKQGAIVHDIDYGESEKIADLLQLIARREGIGDILARGIVPAADEWGLDHLAIHVKGMEPAGYDPRVLKGMGLAYGTSPRGACHLRTTFYKPEIAGMIPPDTIQGKAEMLIDFEDRLTLFDSLILCRFYRDLYSWEELAKVMQLSLGIPFTKDHLRSIASEITTLTRRFNLREGLKPEQDHLPERFHKEPLPNGDSLTRAEMDHMLSDYYRLRGWDVNGQPLSS